MIRPEPAVRVHPARGIREEIAFFGGESPGMFGSIHLPLRDPIAGLVICPPIHAELFRSYRKEVLLARELAARGIAVHRFHYRGVGNSEGDNEHVTLETMISDTREARQALAARARVDRIAMQGTRLGAIPATVASGDDGDTPLVLWDPIPDGDSYMKEALRSQKVHEIVRNQDPGSGEAERGGQSTGTFDRLQMDGEIDILGYRLTRSFYQSLAARRLLDTTPKGPVYLVSFGSDQQAQLIEAWTGAGVDLTAHRAPKPAWWLIGEEYDSEDSQQALKDLVSSTLDWLVGRLGQTKAP